MKECQKDISNTIIQENNVSAHAHSIQDEIFFVYEVQCLLWSENSLNLNMIELIWFWMKWRIISWEASWDRKTARSAWIQTWKNLSQNKIQQWIEWILCQIQEIICLKEDNEYKKRCTDRCKRQSLKELEW